VNLRVLIVDDARDVLVGLRELLAGRYEVHAARSAQEALALGTTHGPFAVVVSDHQMPGMSGTELLGEFERRWPSTIRIMMTGHAELELAVKALHEGAIFRFLTKPTPPEVVRRAVEAGIRKFREEEDEQLLMEQLQFSREALVSLTHTLERRLADQEHRIHGLQQFAGLLNEAASVEEVVRITSESCARLFPGRAVCVGIEDPTTEHEVAHAFGEARELTVCAVIANSGEELGYIRVDLQNERDEPLTGADRSILEALAVQAGIAVHGILHKQERERAQHATIYALARLAEQRDDETGRHLERVSGYCRLIALGLRSDGHFPETLTDAYVHDLVRSAPLHDIGKVGIPDAILLKPAALSPEEWETMKTHATIGAETLRSVLESSGEQSFLRMGHEIAWGHHERWDGTGYPRALRGEEIPLAARIVAVADCYDALTTRRPYKEAWSHEKALNQLLHDSGQNFDPRVVAAFVKRADQADRIRRDLSDVDEAQPLAG